MLTFFVYTSGSVRYRHGLTAGTNRIPVDGKGIYIVKVGKTVVKTNVR